MGTQIIIIGLTFILSLQTAMSDLSSSIPHDWQGQIDQGNMLFAAKEPNQYLMATGMLRMTSALIIYHLFII